MKRSFGFEVIRLAAMSIAIGVILGRTPVLAQPAPQLPEPAEQLQQLVAPIALYPDELVAQVLAASTHPSQIVEAERWLQQQPNVQSEQLASSVDQQMWDPSVKALTAFPSVVSNMDKNLSWTTALGQAYVTQPQNVLDAVQVMRRRAQDAGNLESTPQQHVTTAGSTIVIEPVSTETCYLPVYDPWVVYGAPLAVYPGYIYEPWFGGPFIAFAPGIHIGYFGRFGWGWPAWGFNWGRRTVVFNRGPFVSRGPVFFHNRSFDGRSFGGNRSFRGFGGFRGGGFRSGGFRSGGFRGFGHRR